MKSFIAPNRQTVLFESQVMPGLLDHTPFNDTPNDNEFDLPLVTESMIQLMLQPEDNKRRLVCRAENPVLRQSALEGTLTLNVACK